MLPRHLSPQEQAALRHFLEHARPLCGDELLEMRLYGSRARGEGHAESDLDIFVLLKTKNKQIERALDDLAADSLVEYGILLDPRVWGEDTWNTWMRHERALALAIQTEGIAL